MTSTLNYDAVVRLLMADDPNLGYVDALPIADRIIAHPGKPGACVHRMPNGLAALDAGRYCVRCGSKPVYCATCDRYDNNHVEGCPSHPDYFRDCVMDARYRRSEVR